MVGINLFKVGSFEAEIERSMAENIKLNAANKEKRHMFEEKDIQHPAHEEEYEDEDEAQRQILEGLDPYGLTKLPTDESTLGDDMFDGAVERDEISEQDIDQISPEEIHPDFSLEDVYDPDIDPDPVYTSYLNRERNKQQLADNGMDARQKDIEQFKRLHELGKKMAAKYATHKQCNCEQIACKHEAGSCKNKAGDKKAMYIGSICDDCAKHMPEKYMKKACDYLNEAATILDETGYAVEAEFITKLLEKIAETTPKKNSFDDSEYTKITMMRLRKDHPAAYEALPYELLDYPRSSTKEIQEILEEKETNNVVIKLDSGEIFWNGSEWDNSAGPSKMRAINPYEQSLKPIKRRVPGSDKDEVGEDDLGFAAKDTKHHEKKPATFEFESLIKELNEDMPKDEDELGEQVIKMRSIAGKKKV